MLGSPDSPLRKQDRDRDKRRSQLRTVFPPDDGYTLSVSAPSSPFPTRVLQNAQEDQSGSELPYTRDGNVFGVAALDLRRKRQSAGLEAFAVPPPSYSTHMGHSPAHSSHYSLSSFATPSRFTLLQTNRNPLSLSALHLALHGALSAKRYACSHLLALRFEEDEEDAGYWEDVRSVMALLTSMFADASARLLSALDDAEKRRMKDERPSTDSLVGSSRNSSVSPDPRRKSRLMKTMAEMVSFAPIPSHLTRFAAHVDALSSALNDARDNLEHCVASLRDGKEPTPAANISMVPAADGSLGDVFTESTTEELTPALEAYDRFRRELGYALRECERGRERLLDVIAAMKPAPSSDDEDEAEPASPLQNLAHDVSSVEPAGLESLGPHEQEPALEISVQAIDSWDDATEHLLSTLSERLPSPGVEQVFEAESGGGFPFAKERSKLSREERIKLAKARRESDQAFGAEKETRRKVSGEQWGPGGEVVQELKDVIWKVGEARRRIRDSAPPVPAVHIQSDGDDHDTSAGSQHSQAIRPQVLVLEEAS